MVFSTWQLLRYPVVFGSCLAVYFTAFSYRKTYFKDEIDEAKERNVNMSNVNAAKIEAAKEAAYARKKNSLQS